MRYAYEAHKQSPYGFHPILQKRYVFTDISIVFNSSLVHTLPTGLCGLQKIIILTFSSIILVSNAL